MKIILNIKWYLITIEYLFSRQIKTHAVCMRFNPPVPKGDKYYLGLVIVSGRTT